MLTLRIKAIGAGTKTLPTLTEPTNKAVSLMNRIRRRRERARLGLKALVVLTHHSLLQFLRYLDQHKSRHRCWFEHAEGKETVEAHLLAQPVRRTLPNRLQVLPTSAQPITTITNNKEIDHQQTLVTSALPVLILRPKPLATTRTTTTPDARINLVPKTPTILVLRTIRETRPLLSVRPNVSERMRERRRNRLKSKPLRMVPGPLEMEANLFNRQVAPLNSQVNDDRAQDLSWLPLILSPTHRHLRQPLKLRRLLLQRLQALVVGVQPKPNLPSMFQIFPLAMAHSAALNSYLASVCRDPVYLLDRTKNRASTRGQYLTRAWEDSPALQYPMFHHTTQLQTHGVSFYLTFRNNQINQSILRPFLLVSCLIDDGDSSDDSSMEDYPMGVLNRYLRRQHGLSTPVRPTPVLPAPIRIAPVQPTGTRPPATRATAAQPATAQPATTRLGPTRPVQVQPVASTSSRPLRNANAACAICLDPPAEFPSSRPTSRCTHRSTVCASCLEQHISHAVLTGGLTTVTCPEVGCGQTLGYSDVIEAAKGNKACLER